MREWLAAGRTALVEAPTGTGKSFAGWAIALEWLAADPRNRVVVSTFTKQLQAQLADDLRRLDATKLVPGVIDEASLVKGAANRLSVQGLVRVLADLAQAESDGRRVRRGDFLGDPGFAELVLYLASRLVAEGDAVEEWEAHSVDSVDIEPFFLDYLLRRWGGQRGLRLETYLRFLSQAHGGDYVSGDAAPAEHTSNVQVRVFLPQLDRPIRRWRQLRGGASMSLSMHSALTPRVAVIKVATDRRVKYAQVAGMVVSVGLLAGACAAWLRGSPSPSHKLLT
jgi:hypothetical protein